MIFETVNIDTLNIYTGFLVAAPAAQSPTI